MDSIRQLCHRHNFLSAEDLLFNTNNLPRSQALGEVTPSAVVTGLGAFANQMLQPGYGEESKRVAHAAFHVRAAIVRRFPEHFAPAAKI